MCISSDSSRSDVRLAGQIGRSTPFVHRHLWDPLICYNSLLLGFCRVENVAVLTLLHRPELEVSRASIHRALSILALSPVDKRWLLLDSWILHWIYSFFGVLKFGWRFLKPVR